MGSKTEEHRIRNLSENQFEAFIYSLDWELDPPKHDYGLDYWLEVFRGGNPTGDIFRVQLKGTGVLRKHQLKRQDVLFYDIPILRLRDWFKNIIPVYFVLWDVVDACGYWLHVQDFISSQLALNGKWLDISRQSQKKRIHIPLKNVIKIGQSQAFEESIKSNLEKLRDSGQALQWLEDSRQIDWSDIRFQIDQLSLADHSDIQNNERLAGIEIVLKVDEHDNELWLEKAQIHYTMMQYEQALLAINKAYQIDSESVDVLGLRGCIFCDYARDKNGKPKHLIAEAIECFEKIADAITKSSLHYNLGNCYAGLEQHQTAIAHYDIALAENPDDKSLEAQIWKNRGTSFFHLKDYEEEQKSYEKALQLMPHLWEAHFSMATTLIHLQQFKEAKTTIQDSLDYVPRSPSLQAQVYYMLAYVKWKLEEDIEALTIVNQVLDMSPQNSDARILKTHLLMSLWRQDDKYIEEAKRFFGTMVLADPENVLAKGELHLIFRECGQFEQARRIIKEAIDTSSDIPPMMYYDYAMLLKEDGKIEDAISNLLLADSIETNHAIQHQLGHLYFKRHNYLTALEWYQKAIASSNHPKHMLWDIANCQFFLGEYQRCAFNMMELLLFDPFQESVWSNLAAALQRIGLYDAYVSMESDIDKVTSPDQLAKAFDVIVKKIDSSYQRNWMYKNVPLNDKDASDSDIC